MQIQITYQYFIYNRGYYFYNSKIGTYLFFLFLLIGHKPKYKLI